jgi:transposase
MQRVKELRSDNDWLGPVLNPILNARASIATQLKIVSTSVLTAAREDADARRMMTVPGIGAMTALAFKAAVDDPKRFTSSTKSAPILASRHANINPAKANVLAVSARPTIRFCARISMRPLAS